MSVSSLRAVHRREPHRPHCSRTRLRPFVPYVQQSKQGPAMRLPAPACLPIAEILLTIASERSRPSLGRLLAHTDELVYQELLPALHCFLAPLVAQGKILVVLVR